MEILLLTVLGFALILLDLLLIPGAIFIVFGSGLILFGVYVNYQENGFWMAAVHLLLCLATIPKLVTWSLGRVALKSELRSKDGYVGLENRSGYIGMKGYAYSDLRPSGSVAIDIEGSEERVDCIAEGGFIMKGAAIIVTEERGPSLVVRETEPSDAA